MDYEARFEGRKVQSDDARSAYDIDYSRIVHSASFRRLQGKTQILNLGDSDFYRTRLTHSLEVSQIAVGVLRHFEKNTVGHPIHDFLPSQTLLQAIALAHDLGHPPFGHGGEVALNYCMRDHGGFEGNGQTLRILTKLEKFSSGAGADLTRRTLLGLLKYPASYSTLQNKSIIPALNEKARTIDIIDREKSKPPKCYLDAEKDIVSWLLKEATPDDAALFTRSEPKKDKHSKTLHKSFDCSIMDVADDISYGIHDLEDAIALKLINEDMFKEDVPDGKCAKFLNELKSRYNDEFANNVYGAFVKKLFSDSSTRKRQIGRLVYHFLSHIEIHDTGFFEEPLFRYRARVHPEYIEFLDALKNCVLKRVIKSPNVQHLEFKGQKMVVSVFEALCSEPEAFLPLDVQKQFKDSGNDIRTICDYVAGMTDTFLLKTFDRLFSPRMGSVFDKL